MKCCRAHTLHVCSYNTHIVVFSKLFFVFISHPCLFSLPNSSRLNRLHRRLTLCHRCRTFDSPVFVHYSSSTLAIPSLSIAPYVGHFVPFARQSFTCVAVRPHSTHSMVCVRVFINYMPIEFGSAYELLCMCIVEFVFLFLMLDSLYPIFRVFVSYSLFSHSSLLSLRLRSSNARHPLFHSRSSVGMPSYMFHVPLP